MDAAASSPGSISAKGSSAGAGEGAGIGFGRGLGSRRWRGGRRDRLWRGHRRGARQRANDLQLAPLDRGGGRGAGGRASFEARQIDLNRNLRRLLAHHRRQSGQGSRRQLLALRRGVRSGGRFRALSRGAGATAISRARRRAPRRRRSLAAPLPVPTRRRRRKRRPAGRARRATRAWLAPPEWRAARSARRPTCSFAGFLSSDLRLRADPADESEDRGRAEQQHLAELQRVDDEERDQSQLLRGRGGAGRPSLF